MSGPALARYNPDGSLDATFGTGGTVTGPLSGGPGSNGLGAIALQANGDIVGAGTLADEGGFVRYLASGALDPTFGTDGVATVLHVGFAGLAIQSDGSYIGAGRSVSMLFAVVRTLSDGTLDPNFGMNGVVTTAFPASSGSSASAVVIQGDGKIVGAGALENSQSAEIGFALARYIAGTVAPPDDQCAQVGGSRDFLRTANPKLTVRNVSTPGKGKLSLRASFLLPTGTSFSNLTPATDGARLVIDSAAGGTLVDVSLAAGTYAGRGTRGWRTNGTHTKWTFTDSTGAPVNGVSGMTIKDESRVAPGQVAVRVKGKGGTYPVVLSDLPVQVVVVLGGAAASAAGECGQSEFHTAECHLPTSGGKLICEVSSP